MRFVSIWQLEGGSKLPHSKEALCCQASQMWKHQGRVGDPSSHIAVDSKSICHDSID